MRLELVFLRDEIRFGDFPDKSQKDQTWKIMSRPDVELFSLRTSFSKLLGDSLITKTMVIDTYH